MVILSKKKKMKSVKLTKSNSNIIILCCFSWVTLDGPLSDLLLNKGEYTEALRWDEIFSRCQSKLGPGYQIRFPGKRPELKKGKPEPIVFNVAQRSGNKKVNIEAWYISN